jgi:hypothetical protein
MAVASIRIHGRRIDAIYIHRRDEPFDGAAGVSQECTPERIRTLENPR